MLEGGSLVMLLTSELSSISHLATDSAGSLVGVVSVLDTRSGTGTGGQLPKEVAVAAGCKGAGGLYLAALIVAFPVHHSNASRYIPVGTVG